MKKLVHMIQVHEGLISSLLQKMSSPQNMLLTDNLVNAKLFEDYAETQTFIRGLEKTYTKNELIRFNIVDATLEVELL